MQRLSDLALIAQVVTLGSERAFGQLVHAHQEAVRRFLRRLTAGDEMRADDLAQETFIRAWQGLNSFKQLSGFQTWLMSIAYRVFLDDERAQKRSPLSHEGEGLAAIDKSSIGINNISREASTVGFALDLDRALATLSEAERTCVTLQCVEEQSIKDIAVITGMNENTVKSHLLRGKQNLANYLKRNGYDGKR